MPVVQGVPVIRGKACSGNERGGAHKHKVMGGFIMALQSLERNIGACYKYKKKNLESRSVIVEIMEFCLPGMVSTCSQKYVSARD